MSTTEDEEVRTGDKADASGESVEEHDDSVDLTKSEAEAGSGGAVDAVADSSEDESDAGADDESLDESLDIEVESEDPELEEDADPTAELQAKIAELEEGKKDNYDRFLRASADLENYRKRARRDVKDARVDERSKVLKDMLPVIDNLERAVIHAEESDNEATKSILEGVNLVLRQFKQTLERHNVTPVDAVGKPFDPAMHEAVTQAPSADHPPGTVISVLQTGYMVEGRLLRPALAVVSIAMPAAEPEAQPGEEVESEAEEGAGDEESAVAEAEKAGDSNDKDSEPAEVSEEKATGE